MAICRWLCLPNWPEIVAFTGKLMNGQLSEVMHVMAALAVSVQTTSGEGDTGCPVAVPQTKFQIYDMLPITQSHHRM